MSIFMSNGTANNEKSRTKLRRGSVPVLYPGLKFGGKSLSTDPGPKKKESGKGFGPLNYPPSAGHPGENGQLNMYMCTLRETSEYDNEEDLQEMSKDAKVKPIGCSYDSQQHNGGTTLNMNNLKEMLKCSGCHKILYPPILQCLSGHMICKICSEKRPVCGKCEQNISEVPAAFAETISQHFQIPCSYQDRGCQEMIPFRNQMDHEELCHFKPVQCPEFDCSVSKPMCEILKHFRSEHHHHFVNAHGSVFNGDIRCDDGNMIMGSERRWAPTMMRLDPVDGESNNNLGDSSNSLIPGQAQSASSSSNHFFLEIIRTKHGIWHMWVWYLGEPEDASAFKCEISIRKKSRDEESELKYSGRVHSVRIPPNRIILSGCLLTFTDFTVNHFRYLGGEHGPQHLHQQRQHHILDYKVQVNRVKKPGSNERAVTAGLTKMLRRFSIDSTGGTGGKLV